MDEVEKADAWVLGKGVVCFGIPGLVSLEGDIFGSKENSIRLRNGIKPGS